MMGALLRSNRMPGAHHIGYGVRQTSLQAIREVYELLDEPR